MKITLDLSFRTASEIRELETIAVKNHREFVTLSQKFVNKHMYPLIVHTQENDDSNSQAINIQFPEFVDSIDKRLLLLELLTEVLCPIGYSIGHGYSHDKPDFAVSWKQEPVPSKISG